MSFLESRTQEFVKGPSPPMNEPTTCQHPRFSLRRDRKPLAGALEQTFHISRNWRGGMGRLVIVTTYRPPRPGRGYWASYYRVRCQECSKTLANLGRSPSPDDPATVEILARFGMTADRLRDALKCRRRVRQARLDTRNRRRASGGFQVAINCGHRVRPRGTGPNYGMRGTVPSRFKKSQFK